MTLTALIILLVLFLVTSIVGVVTGSNSLITVPVMFQFGIDEKTAVATNMFGLTFMAAGGAIPFLRKRMISVRSSWPMILLTVAGSALGGLLVGVITNQGLKLVVSIAMIAVAVFTVFRGSKRADEAARPVEGRVSGVVMGLVFGLAVYGGLYSGGYVTLLTALLAAYTAMPFIEAIGLTKLLNVFSSGIATLIFLWNGLVDLKLGLMLAAVMFVGAYAGAHLATRMNESFLRWVFLTTVITLAVKMLYDLSWSFV
ncbi:MAG: sulfite exporter TauE/SafE family protein [Pyrinomonadaceae bacterium]